MVSSLEIFKAAWPVFAFFIACGISGLVWCLKLQGDVRVLVEQVKAVKLTADTVQIEFKEHVKTRAGTIDRIFTQLEKLETGLKSRLVRLETKLNFMVQDGGAE